MHASSMENMQKCYLRYVQTHFKSISSSQPLKVVDIGGANVNGSYRDIFSNKEFTYIAADIENAEHVDVVLDDPYKLPFETNSIDILISGQAFEHVEMFWLLFDEMARVLSPQGLLILIVPSAGPIHRYPVDCYRFYPDALTALSKASNIHLIDYWMDNRGPWNDLVGVFSKSSQIKKFVYEQKEQRVFSSEKNIYEQQSQPQFYIESKTNSEEEKINGEQHYLKILEKLHAQLDPQLYLEIGVREGHSLSLAKCSAHAVDPIPKIQNISKNHILHTMTSDEFFEFKAHTIFNHPKPDLVFIDGMHFFEYVLRDFINAEQYSHENTMIVIDDVLPNHPKQASRQRSTNIWTGDVWKIYFCLKMYRPDLKLTMIDSSPTGLLIIANLNANNKTLLQQYNPIVRQFKQISIEEYPEIITRLNAISFEHFESILYNSNIKV